MKDGLLPISQHAQLFYGRVSYHDYEAASTSTSARPQRDLGQNPVMILHMDCSRSALIPPAFRIYSICSSPARPRSPRWPAARRSTFRRPPSSTPPPAVAPMRHSAPNGLDSADAERKDPTYRT
jgi:hypothetical protein